MAGGQSAPPGLVATLPDLGNATIIVLIMVVMISVSGIAYRWFSTAVLGIVAASTVILGTIRILGVETVEKFHSLVILLVVSRPILIHLVMPPTQVFN